MGGIASVLYGVVVYTVFLFTFLYAIAFVGDLPVPKTILITHFPQSRNAW